MRVEGVVDIDATTASIDAVEDRERHAEGASIARLIAGESSALPSPLAPNRFTSKNPALFRTVGADATVAFRLFVWLWVSIDPQRETSKIRKTRMVESALFVFIVISTRGVELAKQNPLANTRTFVAKTSVCDSMCRAHRPESVPLIASGWRPWVPDSVLSLARIPADQVEVLNLPPPPTRALPK